MNLIKNLSSIFIFIFANMVETIINHPPVITIFMGAINHSQSWLVDSIVLPTLHRLEFDVIGSCPAVPSLPPLIPVPSGPKRNLHLFKLMQVSTLSPHLTPSEKLGPLKYVYIYIYIYTCIYIYTYIGVGTVIIGNYLLQYPLTIPKVHILWFVISRPPTRTWTLLLPFSSPPLLLPRQLQSQQPRQLAVDLSQRFAPASFMESIGDMKFIAGDIDPFKSTKHRRQPSCAAKAIFQPLDMLK